ncbi:GH32 C-terminal domain-containing protein [Arthrobacter bambusae]|uniref:GH32 C-terminal domain-containing protein n=1 Tax=Arthrobacter bambusae TaxID=1338426 RepID=UPI0027D81097|nr:GH32 C-terminal domain-containing protein [Arthrobacter bambusae]
MDPGTGRLTLRVLVDRTSVEMFVSPTEVSVTRTACTPWKGTTASASTPMKAPPPSAACRSMKEGE